VAVGFIGVPEYPEKTTDLSKSLIIFITIVLSTPRLIGVRTHNISGDRH